MPVRRCVTSHFCYFKVHNIFLKERCFLKIVICAVFEKFEQIFIFYRLHVETLKVLNILAFYLIDFYVYTAS